MLSYGNVLRMSYQRRIYHKNKGNFSFIYGAYFAFTVALTYAPLLFPCNKFNIVFQAAYSSNVSSKLIFQIQMKKSYIIQWSWANVSEKENNNIY